MTIFDVPEKQRISIHPPRVGRDRDDADESEVAEDISIHPPRVGRDWQGENLAPVIRISIHPPRVGRDERRSKNAHCYDISIHPPRVGRDSKSSQKFFVNFCARR